jgi:3'(2'), 5'-bisphosphate nucleotidase
VHEESDVDLATRLAVEAGDLLNALRTSAGPDADPWELGDQGDSAANIFLLEQLRHHRPTDFVLSEEAADPVERLAGDRVWIVDPLDGTREYRAGRHDWAVHVALWERGRGLTAAAVSLPALGEVRSTGAPGVRSTRNAGPVVLVSRSRRPWEADLVAAALHGVVDTLGSAGAKAMAVVSGRADVYLAPGGLWEWDAAAPVAVAAAAGLDVTDGLGRPLPWNREVPWVDGLVICRPEFTATVFETLAAVG